MADRRDILSENEEQLSDEDLLKYLEGTLSPDKKDFIEKKLATTSFESDAISGLQKIKNTEKLKDHVVDLNQKLHQQLHTKKQRKEKRKIKDFHWIILCILILLFICIISYVVILMHNKASPQFHTFL